MAPPGGRLGRRGAVVPRGRAPPAPRRRHDRGALSRRWRAGGFRVVTRKNQEGELRARCSRSFSSFHFALFISHCAQMTLARTFSSPGMKVCKLTPFLCDLIKAVTHNAVRSRRTPQFRVPMRTCARRPRSWPGRCPSSAFPQPFRASRGRNAHRGAPRSNGRGRLEDPPAERTEPPPSHRAARRSSPALGRRRHCHACAHLARQVSRTGAHPRRQSLPRLRNFPRLPSGVADFTHRPTS